MCCDEAMKLVTCLLILTFGYHCEKRSSSGEYRQLSSRESTGKCFRDDDGYEIDDESSSIGVKVNDIESEITFLSYLRRELQVRVCAYTIKCFSGISTNSIPCLLAINSLIGEWLVFFRARN